MINIFIKNVLKFKKNNMTTTKSRKKTRKWFAWGIWKKTNLGWLYWIAIKERLRRATKIN